MKKIKILSIQQACAECPFYVIFDNSQYDCVFKNMVEEEFDEDNKKFVNPLIGVFNDIVPNKQHYINNEKWDENCRGKYENCVFLHSMYDWNSEEDVVIGNEVVEDYQPYRKNDDEKPQAYKPSIDNVKISVHLVPSPYKVKADMLVYPNNNLLEILDPVLQTLSGFKLQNQLNRINENGVPIKMGHVYNTDASNIPELPFKSVAHAIVSGGGGLTEEKYISTATNRSLLLADSIQCKSLVITPMDCGTLNVYQGALAQISAVLRYFEENQESQIEKIYFVVTTREVFNTYEEYYARIFKKENPAHKKYVTDEE